MSKLQTITGLVGTAALAAIVVFLGSGADNPRYNLYLNRKIAFNGQEYFPSLIIERRENADTVNFNVSLQFYRGANEVESLRTEYDVNKMREVPIGVMFPSATFDSLNTATLDSAVMSFTSKGEKEACKRVGIFLNPPIIKQYQIDKSKNST
jgi:hypothetical protein